MYGPSIYFLICLLFCQLIMTHNDSTQHLSEQVRHLCTCNIRMVFGYQSIPFSSVNTVQAHGRSDVLIIYLHIPTHTCSHTHTHTHTHTRMHTYTHACTHARTHSYTHTHTHTRMHTHTYTHAHAHTHTHTHVHTHHAHTHTHNTGKQ